MGEFTRDSVSLAGGYEWGVLRGWGMANAVRSPYEMIIRPHPAHFDVIVMLRNDRLPWTSFIANSLMRMTVFLPSRLQ